MFGWTRCHCWPTGDAFKKDGLKEACCAGDSPTGTVTDAGVTDTRIPESNPTIAFPVFLVSASEVAVKVSTGTGLGKLDKVGAVYVRTFEPLVVVITHVPNVPVPPGNVPPLVQEPVLAVGLGTVVVGSGV